MMTDLIKELKNEHIFIVEILHKAKNYMITTEEGQITLRSAKKSFLEHIKKEDEKLYPVLKEAAQNDLELQQIVSEFTEEMDVVSKATIEFFDKYSNGGNGEKFAADFARFYIKLSRRIKNEEKIVYEKYDELMMAR